MEPVQNSIELIGQKRILEHYKQSIKQLEKSQGSITIINGESGSGKTFLLRYLEQEAILSKHVAVYSLAQNPIGKMKVGNLQPMLPFARAIEALMNFNTSSAEKKLMMNVGLTVLASIPVADIVFYAVKEISRDWRQFKKDKSQDKKNVSSAVSEYYDALCAYADKNPIIILLDDMHWADAQSVELLNILVDNIADLRISLIITYKQSIIDSTGAAFEAFLKNPALAAKNVVNLKIDTFSIDDVSKAAKMIMPNYQKNEEFESQILDRSFGVPGVTIEYLKYFAKNNPLDKSGNLAQDLKKVEYLPASMQALFSQEVGNLTEEDKSILSICAAEGVEFTVSLVSRLLNLDVLTAIKKLRAIQNRTNLIKSIGAHFRYGEKTTVYRFVQGFYQSFFERQLEFEEYIALHGEIANLLKEKYNNSKIQEVKDSIAPFLAAHSVEAGDKDTAETMLLQTAESSKKYGSMEVIKEAYQDYIFLNDGNEELEDSDNDKAFKRIMQTGSETSISNSGMLGFVQNASFGDVQFNFIAQFDELSNMFLDGHFQRAIDRADEIVESYKEVLSNSEFSRIKAFKAKCLIEKKDLKAAENVLNELIEYLKQNPDNEGECLVYNNLAILESEKGNNAQARFYINQAAQSAVVLAPEMKLLTVSNIAIIMKDTATPGATKYYAAAKRLAEDMNFKEFLNELGLRFDTN